MAAPFNWHWTQWIMEWHGGPTTLRQNHFTRLSTLQRKGPCQLSLVTDRIRPDEWLTKIHGNWLIEQYVWIQFLSCYLFAGPVSSWGEKCPAFYHHQIPHGMNRTPVLYSLIQIISNYHRQFFPPFFFIPLSIQSITKQVPTLSCAFFSMKIEKKTSIENAHRKCIFVCKTMILVDFNWQWRKRVDPDGPNFSFASRYKGWRSCG